MRPCYLRYLPEKPVSVLQQIADRWHDKKVEHFFAAIID